MEPSLRLRAETPGAQVPPGASAEGVAAAFAGATGWLNSPPLTPSDLHGRVVLVDFWTYTCINWLRTLPYLRAWRERYASHGLKVVGVHTPEFDFEGDIDNVRRATDDLRVEHPVAIDTDYAIWNAFGNRYWPARYLIDAQGRVRYHHFGEGAYEQSEQAVRHLLTEAGDRATGHESGAVDGRGVEAPADWDSLRTPETYLGHDRAENFLPEHGLGRDARHVYDAPVALPLNHWALSGDWTVRRQATVLNRAGGRIAFRFHARDVHLIMGPVARDRPARFHVTIDGRPPGAAHGLDVDGRGAGAVSEPRLHQLVRQPGPILERTLEITFSDPGVRAYAFTFG